MMRTLSCALALLALPSTSYADVFPVPVRISETGPVSTSHKGIFNGTLVDYVAKVDETPVSVPQGPPSGVMVTTSYVRTGMADTTARPVVFVFAGGPGAASSAWHLKGLGPMIVRPDGSFADNSLSPLDAMDLVFIDPIGTGWSTIVPTKSVTSFWNTTADTASVIEFIAGWLKANGREASPRYVAGGSYASKRAALVALLGPQLHLDGVVLESSMGMPGDPDLPFVMTFPTFAAAAAYHGKADARGRSPRQIFEENARFARTELLPALFQGDALPEREKTRLAAEMSRRIGLPAELIRASNLRIEEDAFMFNLLKARGLRTGLLDTRASGEIAVYTRRSGPYADPGYDMTLETPTTIHGAGLPEGKPNLVERYARETLGYRSTRPYQTLNLDMLFSFRHDMPLNDFAILKAAEAMMQQPKLRLMAAGGLYDLTTPLYPAMYSIEHAGAEAKRMTLEVFESGHDVYAGEKNLRQFVTALRRFVGPDR